MTPLFVGELMIQTEALDALTEWDDAETDLEAELHELGDGSLGPGVFTLSEDEGRHLMDLARRVH